MLPPNLLFVASHPLLLLFAHTLSIPSPTGLGESGYHIFVLFPKKKFWALFPFHLTGRNLGLRLMFLFCIPSYYRSVEDRTIWRKFFLGTVYGRGRVFVISFVLYNLALLPFSRCPTGDLCLGVRLLAWLESPFFGKVAYRKPDKAWDVHGGDGERRGKNVKGKMGQLTFIKHLC